MLEFNFRKDLDALQKQLEEIKARMQKYVPVMVST
jgi:hypothetical protein